MTHPTPTTTSAEVVARAAIGPVPGWAVVVAMALALFYAGLIALGAFSFWVSRMTQRLPAGHPGRMEP